MDFKLSTEQQMLKDSINRLLAERYDFTQRGLHANEPEGWSLQMWKQYADMGLLSIPFSEEDGGFGGGASETMVAMQSLGRALALEPYFATVVMAGGFLRLGGSAAQRTRFLPALMAGEHLLSFAHIEPGVRQSLHTVNTTARRRGDGWLLNGDKAVVLHGDCADTLIVSARISGLPHVASGLALFIVNTRADGVERKSFATQDGRRAADFSFTDVHVRDVDVLGVPEDAWPLMEQVFDAANAALCAEALGVMESMLELTLGYLKTRSQFGATLGSFQGVQHQTVEMLMALEQARSMTLYATAESCSAHVDNRRRAVSGAKVQVARAARLIGQKAVQLHGGIGMTDEYKLGHDFKRVSMFEAQLGDASYHLARVARAGGYIATER